MDTIYFSHDSHELALADFEHLDQRDLICIISALEHNTWFHKLTVSPNTTKLSSEVVDKILSVVSKSVSLQVPYRTVPLSNNCGRFEREIVRKGTGYGS